MVLDLSDAVLFSGHFRGQDDLPVRTSSQVLQKGAATGLEGGLRIGGAVTGFALHLEGGAAATVEVPIAMNLSCRMAIDAVHTGFEVNICWRCVVMCVGGFSLDQLPRKAPTIALRKDNPGSLLAWCRSLAKTLRR